MQSQPRSPFLNNGDDRSFFNPMVHKCLSLVRSFLPYSNVGSQDKCRSDHSAIVPPLFALHRANSWPPNIIKFDYRYRNQGLIVLSEELSYHRRVTSPKHVTTWARQYKVITAHFFEGLMTGLQIFQIWAVLTDLSHNLNMSGQRRSYSR